MLVQRSTSEACAACLKPFQWWWQIAETHTHTNAHTHTHTHTMCHACAEIHIRSVCCLSQALPVVVAMLKHACTSNPLSVVTALETGSWLYVQQSLLSDLQESEGAYLQVDRGRILFLVNGVLVEPAFGSSGVRGSLLTGRSGENFIFC